MLLGAVSVRPLSPALSPCDGERESEGLRSNAPQKTMCSAAKPHHEMERGVRRLSRHLSHGQTLGFQVVAGFVAVIELIGFEGALPMTKFFGQGRVDFAVSAVVSVIPKPVMTSTSPASPSEAHFGVTAFSSLPDTISTFFTSQLWSAS